MVTPSVGLSGHPMVGGIVDEKMNITLNYVQVMKIDIGTFTEGAEVIVDSDLNEFVLLTEQCVTQS